MRPISKNIFTILICLSFTLITVIAFAQGEKYKARIAAQYVKVMGKESMINISAKYKTEGGFEKASGLEFAIYKNVSDDSAAYIGKTKTNERGQADFILKPSDINISKSSHVLTYIVKIENSNQFEDNETSVSFSDANLKAEMSSEDSTIQIIATLTDAAGNPLATQPLTVELQRMFGALQIGEESYETDENGSVVIPIEEPMPGIDGNLTFEVKLNESEEYGTVKALVTAPIGILVKEESTFDQRTMWSPPTKAPLYLVVTAFLILLGVWIPLGMLAFNLYRISKSG